LGLTRNKRRHVSTGSAMQKIRAAACLLIVLLIARPAWAAPPVPQPPADLGATSFLDGEVGPGFLLELIGNAYSAGYVTDDNGRALPGYNGQSGNSLTLHTAYISGVPAFGGHLGFESLLPLALVDPSQRFTDQRSSYPGIATTCVRRGSRCTMDGWAYYFDRQRLSGVRNRKQARGI